MTNWPVDPVVYGQYLVMAAGMAVAPGPANLFALATGLEKGPRAGLTGVAGMNTASLVWFLAAALGLGALMKAFPQAFGVLAIVGGLYLAWLGFKALRAAADPTTKGLDMGNSKGANRPFLDGFVVQISNPKALLFFTAVLPPFVDADRPIVPQLAMFGVGIIGFDIIQMSLYALAGSFMASKFGDQRFARMFSAAIGMILMTTAALVLLRARVG
jgi:threonine/homoserine/homoserine lactone efflux protein